MSVHRWRRTPTWRALSNQQGIALIAVLVAVTLLGLMAGIAGSTWQTVRQRAREADLLWKGGQIRKAIESYYTTSHGSGTANFYPSSLEQLVRDPRFLAVRRHLRRLYPDPMTGEDWILVKAPNGRIKGVRSSSELTPFKQDGFSSENEDLAGKQSYEEWLFVYEPKKSATGSKTPAAGSPASGSSQQPAPAPKGSGPTQK